MKFNDTFEKYKWGKVTDEEKEFIEKELKKYEAIREYLDDEDRQDKESISDKSKQSEKKMIGFRGIVGGAMAVVLVVVCIFGTYVYNKKIVPMYKQYEKQEKVKYWNFNTSSILEGERDLDIGLECFYRLHMSGISTAYFDQLTYIDESQGKFFYKLTKTEEDTSPGTIMGIGEEGCMPEGFSISHCLDPYRNDFIEMEKRPTEVINSIPGGSEVMAFITLQEDLSQQDLLGLLADPDKTDSILWLGIRNNDRLLQMEDEYDWIVGDTPIGILLNPFGYSLNDLYPMYNMNNKELDGMGEAHLQYTAELLLGNLLAMIDFQIDHPEILKFLGHSDLTESGFYEKTKEYLSENELSCYGFTVRGSKEDIQAVCKGLDVYHVEIASDDDSNIYYATWNKKA